MNFYPHHIGDFNNATRHLTNVERYVYRELIELYYDTEKPLNKEKKLLKRRMLLKSDEEIKALDDILSEFFILEEDGFHNKRCNLELEKYYAKASAKSKAGKASARKRELAKIKAVEVLNQQNSTGVEQVLNRCSTDVQQNVNNQNQNQNQNQNHDPEPLTRTINQNEKPLTKKEVSKDTHTPTRAKKFNPDFTQWQDWDWPCEPDEEMFNAWLQMRKTNKHTVSVHSFKLIGAGLRESVANNFTIDECLAKAEIKGWKGFEYSWMHTISNNGLNNENFRQPAPSRAKAVSDKLDQIARDAAKRAGIEGDLGECPF